MFKGLRDRLKKGIKLLWSYRMQKGQLRHFDWLLFILVVCISLFGVVCIFSATTTSVTEKPATIMEMLNTQPITYARLQFVWLLAGITAMSAMIYVSYEFYGRISHVIYIVNILLLLSVLVIAEAGRGNMTAFFTWGSDRSFQPSEIGKVMIIISLATPFSQREKPIATFRELLPMVAYISIPLLLIVAQPDFGTALVYVAVFSIMVFVSGMSYKLVLGIIAALVLIAVPAWYLINATGGGFRLNRILMWLNPQDYPDEARQVINAQIAVGSGGIWGKGLVSVGSFASLGYISDDHTDFIFAVVCESFGMAGGAALILAYVLLLSRMAYLAYKVSDPLGSYMIVGVMAMFIFHVVENICMVLGLLPVTGIPLPFMSYGGSNMITNMLGVGLVENVVIRDRLARERVRTEPIRVTSI
jgi:rod shape determining protein RodA